MYYLVHDPAKKIDVFLVERPTERECPFPVHEVEIDFANDDHNDVTNKVELLGGASDIEPDVMACKGTTYRVFDSVREAHAAEYVPTGKEFIVFNNWTDYKGNGLPILL